MSESSIVVPSQGAVDKELLDVAAAAKADIDAILAGGGGGGDSTIAIDLASTAHNKGASLVGIEDAGTLYTATTVESALAEVRTAANNAQSDADAAQVTADASAVAASDAQDAADAAQSTANAAVVATDLASTAHNKGASLIGIEDTGGLYTATNAESALAEVRTAANTAQSTASSASSAASAAQTTANAAVPTSDLASTAHNKGASLVGIEDVGTLITATNVETALAEIVGKANTAQSTANTAQTSANSAQTTANAATVATDLASTSSNKGASLVGIQDTGNKITATTVEGALQEIATTAIAATVATDLASTSSNKGASLVGVQDSGNLYTATNVETALAEVKTEADKASLIGCTVWSGNSAQNSSSFGNGVRYIPLSHSASDYIEFQFLPSYTGTMKLEVNYAMSGSSSNNVRLRVDNLQLGTGDNPTTAATTGTAFTVTPGNDALVHRLTSSDSSDLSLSVTAGKIVYIKFNRLGSDGADTHTSDVRVIDIRVTT